MANTLAWFATAVLFVISSCQDIPEVALDTNNCPVGPGVNKDTILVGTEATCKCVIAKQVNPPAQARWYTKANTIVGVEGGNSSILTFSYNSSELDQSFECRPYSAQSTAFKAVTYTPKYRCSYQIVEKGTDVLIDCPVPSNVGSITWQLLTANTTVNVSTCNVVDKTCTNEKSYKGVPPGPGNINFTSLIVYNTTISETQFVYVTDTGVVSSINELEIYVWPTNLDCNWTDSQIYYDFACQVDNIYPDAKFSLIRKEKPLEAVYLDPKYTTHSHGVYGSGSDGDVTSSSTWRVMTEGLLLNNTFYLQASALVSNQAVVRNKPQKTLYVVINFSVIGVELSSIFCDGRNGNRIKHDEIATCRCSLTRRGATSPEYPQWYTRNNVPVGELDGDNFTSTLTFSYNASDSDQSYFCRPIIRFQANVIDVPYKPQFASSPTTRAGLQSLVITLGAALFGIVSRRV